MWSCLLSILLLHTAQGSLMSRIGLRLGAAHLKKSALDHKPRTPWAVKNMKEEMLANERKPWQPPRPSKIVSKDYKILGYEETTSLVSLADNLLKF